MFDVAWTETFLILVVALVLLGPKELPVVLKAIGRWVAKARQFSAMLEQNLYHWEEHSNKNRIPLTDDGLYTNSLFIQQENLHSQLDWFKNHKLFGSRFYPLPQPWL